MEIEAKATKDVELWFHLLYYYDLLCKKWILHRRMSSGFSVCGLLLQLTMETCTIFSHPTVSVLYSSIFIEIFYMAIHLLTREGKYSILKFDSICSSNLPFAANKSFRMWLWCIVDDKLGEKYWKIEAENNPG